MEVHFSRHARQRLKLYKIDRDDIIAFLEKDNAESAQLGVRRESISYDFVEKYGHPIFVVYVREASGITVVTIFRYDKETKYEDILR